MSTTTTTTNNIRFTNGVYDLEQRVFRDLRLGDADLKCVGYRYVPLAEQPADRVAAFLTYLESLFPDEATREYVLDLIASTFVGGTASTHLFLGTGNNGKSTFVRQLALAHGDRAVQLPTEFYRETHHRPAHNMLYDAAGCAFAWTELDMEGCYGLQADRLRDVSGANGRIEARRRSEPNLGFTPSLAAVIVGKELPPMTGVDADDQVLVRVVPFPVQFTRSTARNADDVRALTDNRVYTVMASLAIARIGRELVPCPAVEQATAEYHTRCQQRQE